VLLLAAAVLPCSGFLLAVPSGAHTRSPVVSSWRRRTALRESAALEDQELGPGTIVCGGVLDEEGCFAPADVKLVSDKTHV
jgi:hypothetical protein